MIKKYKFKLLISFLVTLLPMIVGICFWKKITSGYEMVIHSVKVMAVFVIPSIMVVMNALFIFFTGIDLNKNKQHEKIITMALWIVPVISIYVSWIFYSIILGRDINIQLATSLIMGALFIATGNYMPKSKQNRTFGIKIRWTLANEDNWNATHRFAGKIWFFTGFGVLMLGFLPFVWFFIVLFAVIFAATLAPVLYSYYYYKNNVKSGKQNDKDYIFSKTQKDKAIGIAVGIIIGVILIVCAVLMFTGNIKATLGDEALEINATYHAKESISYADVDSVEYRESANKGMRVMGFSSARLLLGTFRNDEFGVYTRFSYTGCDEEIVITVGENKIVVSCETEEETRAFYDALLIKLGGNGG